jgi:excisionase family DNA binding protein
VKSIFRLFFLEWKSAHTFEQPEIRRSKTVSYCSSDNAAIHPAALSVKDAARYAGISRGQLYRLIDAHGFPHGFMISERRRVFLREDIDRWLKNRAVTANAKTPEPSHLSAARRRKPQ